MIVRGICCIKAGVPGKTDGLVIRQIAGRFLEHARIYAFGADMDTIYLSSADMMTRNTERRVEIAYPVRDPACSQIVRHFIELQLADNVKARQLTSEGTWARIESDPDAPLVVCQEVLLREAYARAKAAVDERVAASKADRIEPEAEAAPALASVEPDASRPGYVEVGATAAEAPASGGQPAPAPRPAVPATASPAPRRGRLSRAMSLFGQAFGTLFGGGDE